MQKTLLLFTLLLSAVSFEVSAQDFKQYYQEAYSKQYPLLVNENVTSVLIFPAAIAEGGIDRGSAGIISKQVDGVPNILKIKAAAKDFTNTNLTVITKDGKVYSFYVTYARYADDKPIDMAKEARKEAAVAFFKDRKLNDAQVRQVAAHIATRKSFMRRPKEKTYGVSVRLQGIYISEDVLFYRISLDNKTHIDYGLDFMRCYIRDKQRVKRTASQEQELQPLFVYKEHGNITAGKTRQTIVIAFPKFTVADHKNFVMQLFEKNGDRNLALKIDGKDIEKAISLPYAPSLEVIK